LVVAFNDALKSNLGSATPNYIGDNVRLVDLEAYFNLVRTSPTTYSFVDTATVVCTSTGTSVGLGGTQKDSSGCGTGTVAPTAYNSYVFADAVYPTPAFHRAWGSNVYTQLIARW
jgi:phospholipase/lecithinase/hemolysin